MKNFSLHYVLNNYRASIYISRWENNRFEATINEHITVNTQSREFFNSFILQNKFIFRKPIVLNKIIGYCLLQLDWDKFTNFYNVVTRRSNFFKWNLIVVIIVIVLFNMLLLLYRGNFLRVIFFNLCWVFLGYWLISTFIFLFKKAQYTSFTRIIQRFWKRSLYLFWLLEVVLFSIYLFLTLIAPQEYLFVDMVSLHYNYVYNLLPFFKNIFLVVVLILSLNLNILLFKYNVSRVVIQTIILVLFLNILQDDFIQFFLINQYYTNTVCVLDVDYDDVFGEKYLWNIEVANLKKRTVLHYFFMLGFLKFWHTFFIVGFFLFFELISLRTKHVSYNILSSNLQNCYFLLFFTFILKIIFFKNYMNYLYEYVYYWFFVNNHFFDYNYFYYLISYKYFIFPLYDFVNFFFN